MIFGTKLKYALGSLLLLDIKFTKILLKFWEFSYMFRSPAFPADPQWFGVTFLSETFLSRYEHGSIGIKTVPHDLPFNYKLYRIEALTTVGL